MPDPSILPPELRDTLEAISGHLSGINGRLTAIEGRLSNAEVGITNLRIEVAEVRGRLSQLPTLWQMAALVLGMLALAMAGQAGLLALLGRMAGRAG